MADQFTKLLSVLILAVILGSTPNVLGQIVHEESRTGGSSSSTTVTTSTNLTSANGHLYLAAISSRPRKLVKSVTGLGLNWVLVKSICSANNSSTGMDVWMAQGTPNGNGVVTATFGSAPSTAVIAVSRYSGVAPTTPIGNVIAGNTNGLNGACTGGVDGTSYSFNLTTTVNGAVVYGAVACKSRAHGPGTGYTERVDFRHPYTVSPNPPNVNPSGVAVVDKSVASAAIVKVDGFFQTAGWGPLDWALVALEIRPPTASSGNAIVHEESQTGGASSSTTVTTAASLAGVSGNLYLAAISSRPRKLVKSVTGLGLNWTLVKSICSGNNSTTMMNVWMAQGTPSGNGAVTATFWSAPSTAVIAVSRYSGVAAANPIGNVIAGNTNGLNGACTGGVGSTSYSFNLAMMANNAVVYGAVAPKARAHGPGAGYTERVDFKYQHPITTTGVVVVDKTVASAAIVAVDGVFHASEGPLDWALVALEIKPQEAIPQLSVVAENQSADDPFPAGYQLEQNYPNPFSGKGISGRSNTLIAFSLPAASQVTVNIYNESGQLVRTLVDDEMPAGQHRTYWNGKNQSGGSLASGVYLYQLVARGRNGEAVFTQTKRLTLLK